MKIGDLVKLAKKAMIKEGAPLDENNDNWGPQTTTEADKYDLTIVAKRKLDAPVIVKDLTLEKLRNLAPWVFEVITMLGWDEVTKDKELTKYCWPNTDDCKFLKSVIGAINAWCSGLWCGAMAKLGLKSTRSGSASSWREYGVKCGYVFGAFLPIRHTNGSNHITVFLWWIDEAKKIAACLGGNQGNHISIAAYNLSGNNNGHDEVVNGPRWPAGMLQPSSPYQPKGWKVGTSLGASTT